MEIFVMTDMVQASPTSSPACDSIASGVVISILRKKIPGCLPHAVLVKFGEHTGMLRAKDMDGDGAERIVTIARGASIVAMVTRVFFNTEGKLRIDLSERALTRLTDLFELPGSHILGTVTCVTTYGVFVDLGNGFPPGLCHIWQLAAVNQEERLANFNKGDSISVVVTSVLPDQTCAGKYRITLSEVQHHINEPSESISSLSDLTETERDGNDDARVETQIVVKGDLPTFIIGAREQNLATASSAIAQVLPLREGRGDFTKAWEHKGPKRGERRTKEQYICSAKKFDDGSFAFGKGRKRRGRR